MKDNFDLKPRKVGAMEEKTAYLFLVYSGDPRANDAIQRINRDTDEKFMRKQPRR